MRGLSFFFALQLYGTVGSAYIYRLDLAAEKVTYLGQHENAVSAMNYAREQSAPLIALSPRTVSLT